MKSYSKEKIIKAAKKEMILKILTFQAAMIRKNSSLIRRFWNV
jgi:hypothetical protein